MNMALIGYGKMGQMVQRVAEERKHRIVSIIDVSNKKAMFREINKGSVKDADVCIDFTAPESAIENIKKVSSLGKNIVVGTTGWYSHIQEAGEIVKKSGVGCIYASNFSIGMNIMFGLTEYASRIFDRFDAYDAAGFEMHHNKKADSPSGTAKSLAEIMKANISRKKRIVYDMVNRRIEPDELHFASLRIGSVPGTHKIIFDSIADTIELSHTARSREGFALGAVLAAEWLRGKKGFYTINDFMKEIMHPDSGKH
ncbi:MAG: 4-hydroxy-tetrahydrodipicolinate reductase [archaeon]